MPLYLTFVFCISASVTGCDLRSVLIAFGAMGHLSVSLARGVAFAKKGAISKGKQ